MEVAGLDMGIRKKLSRMTVSDSNWQMGGEMENTGEGQAPLTLTLPTDTGLQDARGSVPAGVQELPEEPEDTCSRGQGEAEVEMCVWGSLAEIRVGEGKGKDPSHKG